MLLREVEYARPATVEEAVRLLGAHENARVLAGGQSLINVMKVRVASPDVLVDLGVIPELATIEAVDGALEIGAMATYADLILSPEVLTNRPIIAEVCLTIADVQVRNRGTIGGNLCSNDPTNHLPPLASVLGATMTIAGPGGERTVSADEFFEGVYATAVGEGELLTRITIPAAAGAGDGYASLAIGKDGTGIVNVAACVSGNGSIESARVAVGCVAAVPVRAGAMEAALQGATPTEDAVRAAARGLGQTLDPPSDVHASADYRRHLAEVLAVRAVLQAIERAGAPT